LCTYVNGGRPVGHPRAGNHRQARYGASAGSLRFPPRSPLAQYRRGPCLLTGVRPMTVHHAAGTGTRSFIAPGSAVSLVASLHALSGRKPRLRLRRMEDYGMIAVAPKTPSSSQAGTAPESGGILFCAPLRRECSGWKASREGRSLRLPVRRLGSRRPRSCRKADHRNTE
jgi:hypothetical protein